MNIIPEKISPVMLSVIMPCYKGERYIESSIRVVQAELSSCEFSYDIIVVVDGFVDGTYERAKALESEFPNLSVLGYERNQGKGYAISFGVRHSRGKFLAILDSDLDYHPRALPNFIRIAEQFNADLVIGNRRDPKSTYRYPLIRKLFSLGFNLYVNLIYPRIRIWDTQAGIKVIRRDTAGEIFAVLESCEKARGFILDIFLIMIARGRNLRIVQAPCDFHMQESIIGTGGNFLGTAWKMGRDALEAKNEIEKLIR